jgi:hypothetical protein
MKRIFGLIIFLCTTVNSNAQTLDSASAARIVDKANKPIVNAIENQTRLLKDSVVSVINKDNVTSLKANNTVANFIVFLPVVLFLFILITTLVKLKKDNVKLSNFLSDKDASIAIKKEEAAVTIANSKAIEATASAIKANAPAFIAANTVPQEIPSTNPVSLNDDKTSIKQEQSTSRLIAFISGITSVALASCITSFYFYRSFLGESNVSIGNLATVLYGLGLGVIPYGFNKIANALK